MTEDREEEFNLIMKNMDGEQRRMLIRFINMTPEEKAAEWERLRAEGWEIE